MSTKNELIEALINARSNDVHTVWYGNVENAEPVNINDAILDISTMSDDEIGDGTWDVWPE